MTEADRLRVVARDEAVPRNGNGHSPRPGIEFAPASLPELFAKSFPPVMHVVEGIMPEGTTLLGGKPKKGKTWLALNIGLAAAYGGVALGHLPVERNGVLYMWLEGSEELLKDRCHQLLRGEAPPSNFHYVTKAPTMDQDGVFLLREWLRLHPETHFVVVDTLKRVRPPSTGRNAYDEDYEALIHLVDLANEHHISILVVHHLKKNPSDDDPFDEINGTMGLQAVPDTLMVLRGVRGQADAILHVTGRRIREDRALAMQFDSQTGIWEVLGDADDVGLRKERQEIIDCLTEHGPLQPQEIAAMIGKHPVAVRVMVRKMVADEQIDNPRTGLYAAKNPKNGNTGNTSSESASASQTGVTATVTGVTGRVLPNPPPVTQSNTSGNTKLASGSQNDATVTGVTVFSNSSPETPPPLFDNTLLSPPLDDTEVI